ncbi:NUP88 [Cordylochernes scorpioides]|uniref:NUP88 n=1 Tax=Cordylochernes scorpioides TaxID=51811 RepID=A0ABY6KGK0_9ARAC|nr:NUP88 [Cordylochernes scorpioides]
MFVSRIYDISQPLYPIQTIPLGDNNTSISSPTFANYLGENAVCFDFGQPVSALCCPIFILKGNGDVLMIYSDLDRKNSPEVMGPLIMHPAADDNYGVDACSLVCLAVEPPLLAISTSEGLLHHALALLPPPTSDSQQLAEEEEERPELALYVYETIELSLTLAQDKEEEKKSSSPSCPIQLFKDPSTNCRYHCSHEAGIHTIMLPLVRRIELLQELDDSSRMLEEVSSEVPKEMSMSFEQHIRHQLRHTTGGTPLLKSIGEVSPHRALEVLLTAKEKLRRDYIDNLTTAQTGLIRRYLYTF